MSVKRIYFLFFFASGFTALINQLVWVRLAMAHFGVNSVNISIVLSVFMLGQALGSWGGGWLVRSLKRSPSPRHARRAYALAEAVIGIGAPIVPILLDMGRGMLARSGIAWASGEFTLASSLCITVALLPFTMAMGATFPLGMQAVKLSSGEDTRSFSFLYAANVLGAVTGVLLGAFVLFELWGFPPTLYLALAVNFAIALGVLKTGSRSQPAETSEQSPFVTADAPRPSHSNACRLLLFVSGLTGLALEVVWMRLYKPYLTNYVYTFAIVLAVYLAASFLGTILYRRRPPSGSAPAGIWILFGVSCAATLIFTHPDLFGGATVIRMIHAFRLIGIFAPCFLMGWLTPQLVDLVSGGSPDRAGGAYALNIIGSILGPLLSSFVLLPILGERGAITVLASVTILAGLTLVRAGGFTFFKWWGGLTAIVLVGLLSRTPYDHFLSENPEARIIRDHTATAVAFGKGFDRQLFIDGTGMTYLTPITKIMIHLPLAMRPEPPDKILIICFGMGTTYRSGLSWGCDVKNVELVPGVLKLFPFYFDDADTIAARYGSGMIADDGRRFLERSPERYDLVTIDIAPPVRSTGASLLMSRQFLKLVRDRLTEDGVLAHWLPPSADHETLTSMTKALLEVFPHLRVFRSEKRFGFHFLATLKPLADLHADSLVARMPPAAVKDCTEWQEKRPAADILGEILRNELPVSDLLALAPGAPPLDDNRPVNEYFLLRWLGLINWREKP